MRVPIESELDLHAFAPGDIASVVEEYVRAAHETGLRELRFVHGRGVGVQRARVQLCSKTTRSSRSSGTTRGHTWARRHAAWCRIIHSRGAGSTQNLERPVPFRRVTRARRRGMPFA
jgi:hypothetical protein